MMRKRPGKRQEVGGDVSGDETYKSSVHAIRAHLRAPCDDTEGTRGEAGRTSTDPKLSRVNGGRSLSVYTTVQ